MYRDGIEKNGLLPINGLLHLTTDPSLALNEAEWTVRGEDLTSGYKTGVGGKWLIVRVDRDALSGLRLDAPGWYDKDSRKVRRLVAKRVAFRTDKGVDPKHLAFIDKNIESELQKLAEQINEMTSWRLPFQYSPADEANIRARIQRERNTAKEP